MNRQFFRTSPASRHFLIAVLLIVLLSVSAYSSPEYRRITILHTNDIHDYLAPFGPNDTGGLPRIAALSKQIKERGNVLVLDAGDFYEGTPFSIEYGGEATLSVLAAVGYDAVTVGNHDFNIHPDLLRNNGLTLLCANLFDRATGEQVFPTYKIFEIDGVKIAVFGVTINVGPSYLCTREYFYMTDPIEAAKKLVPELKKQADIVVALTHIGFREDKRLAAEVPDIDVIVGGHSHHRLKNPFFVPNAQEKPSLFDIGGTVIVQAGYWSRELGRLDMILRKNDGPFTLMSYSGELLPVGSEIEEDSETALVLDKYRLPVLKKYNEVIGCATAEFDEEYTARYLVCDAIRERTGAKIAVCSSIKNPILKGPIKIWDIMTMMPRHSSIVEIDVTGEQLKTILSRGSIRASGVRCIIEKDTVTEAFVDGNPVKDDAVYTIAIPDWLNAHFFQTKVNRVLYENWQSPVIEYIREHKTITPLDDGRRICR